MPAKLPHAASLQKALCLLDQSGIFNPDPSAPQSPADSGNLWPRSLSASADGGVASGRLCSGAVIAVDSLNGGLVEVRTSGLGRRRGATLLDGEQQSKGVHASKHQPLDIERPRAAVGARRSGSQQCLQASELETSNAPTHASEHQSVGMAADGSGSQPASSARWRLSASKAGSARQSSGHSVASASLAAAGIIGGHRLSEAAQVPVPAAPFAVSSNADMAGALPRAGSVRAYARPPERQKAPQSLLGAEAPNKTGSEGAQATSQAEQSASATALSNGHRSLSDKSSSSRGLATVPDAAPALADNTGMNGSL
jgi:hypothetical protein